MNWITIAWPMVAATCLVMGLINLGIGLALTPRAPHLLFALSAFVVAGLSGLELALLRADSAAQFAALLRWTDVATWATVTSLAGFAWVYLRAGHKWLAVAGPILYGAALVFDFLPGSTGSGLTYLRITGIQTVETFGGATYSVAEGVPNPWNVLPYLGVLLLLAYVVDASARLWRRGNRRRAAVMGGSATVVILAAGVHSALVDAGLLRSPYLISWSYLALMAAMGYELTADVVSAAKLTLQLEEGERRMDLASAAAGLGMWTWDIVRDSIWATKRARSLFSLSESESLNLERFTSALHPDDRDAVRDAIERSLNTDRDYEMEYRAQLPDGQVRWIAARGQVERDRRGKPVLMRGAVLDTTARHRSELELQELRTQLAHAGRVTMMGQLGSALAHELSQPLGAILRNAEAGELFLQAQPPDLDELHAILADIRKDDQRAGDVIDRLRALLKRRSIEPRAVAMTNLFSGVAALTRTDAAARHVALVFEAGPDLPKVTGDAVHLQQVLLNLVMNAMDAVDGSIAGERLVVVRAQQLDGHGIEVVVSDSGPGIPRDKLEAIFEPFFTTKPNGMGIGLPISRTIVEAHGGRIWAENNAKEGATFHFTIPVVEEGAKT